MTIQIPEPVFRSLMTYLETRPIGEAVGLYSALGELYNKQKREEEESNGESTDQT